MTGSLLFNPCKLLVITVQDNNLIFVCSHNGTVKGNSLCTIQVADLFVGAEIKFLWVMYCFGTVEFSAS